ncbi:DUF3488 and transglutaminase-like domain-containing protein [Luedemannella helvata]|uniref:Transglutaminase-like domain-containing protein n=1 Tax=Luedemannella helvata TaxID=349315 RepID=A0ABP4W0B9_9ACTN
MNSRHHVAVIGGIVTMLGSMSLLSIFSSWSWFFYASGAVIAVVGTAMIARRLRVPLWGQTLLMMAALTVILTLYFPTGAEFVGFIPTAETFRHFGELLGEAGAAIQQEAVPVPDLDGLLLIVTLGIGGVAIIVDLCAVGLRRPALAGLALLAIYSVPVAVLTTSVSFIQFGLGAAGFLWLLITDSVDRVRRFGRRFTGEGRDIDVWEPSPLAAAGRRLGIVGIVVAVLLPVVTPGLTTGLIDKLRPNGGTNGTGTGAGTGGSGAVDLTAMLTGSLQRDRPYPMVRVTNSDPTPYYLRFGVADQVNENGFTSRVAAGNRALPNDPDRALPRIEGTSLEKGSARIEIVDFDMPLAPIYLEAIDIDGLDPTWGLDRRFDVVASRQSSTVRKSYTVTYSRRVYTADALRRAGTYLNDEQVTLTTVPQVQEITALVKRLTTGKDTQYDKVRALYNYFGPENRFVYNLNVPKGDSGNAIVDFLRGRQGFCVQYAAALAWLVRAAGYPARVAFGFTRGENAINGQVTLTNRNLHAWTEVYFPNLGWVPFDATPSASVPGSVDPGYAPDLVDTTTPGAQDDPDTGPRSTAEASPGPTDPEAGPEDPGAAGGGDNGAPLWVWLTGLGVLLVLVVLAAPAVGRELLRRRRRSRHQQVIALDVATAAGGGGPSDLLSSADPQGIAQARHDAHQAWAELLDTMTDFAIPVDPTETPRATADRLAAVTGTDTDGERAVTKLARTEEFARYARRPLVPDGLDEAVRRARDTFAAQATRWERLSATFMPRSTVLRWRLRWLRASGYTVARTGRWRDRLAARLSPRRLLTGRR